MKGAQSSLGKGMDARNFQECSGSVSRAKGICRRAEGDKFGETKKEEAWLGFNSFKSIRKVTGILGKDIFSPGKIKRKVRMNP